MANKLFSLQFLKLFVLACGIAISGRYLADFLIAHFPGHNELIDRAVAGLIAIPLCFFVLKPFVQLFGLDKKKGGDNSDKKSD